ncbi:hypothetical protein BKA80DRAFT_263340 [Phyllosticta citrichinensis]
MWLSLSRWRTALGSSQHPSHPRQTLHPSSGAVVSLSRFVVDAPEASSLTSPPGRHFSLAPTQTPCTLSLPSAIVTHRLKLFSLDAPPAEPFQNFVRRLSRLSPCRPPRAWIARLSTSSFFLLLLFFSCRRHEACKVSSLPLSYLASVPFLLSDVSCTHAPGPACLAWPSLAHRCTWNKFS